MADKADTTVLADAIAHPSLDEAAHRAALQRFVLWSLRRMDIDVERDEAGTYRFTVPEEHRDALGGRTEARFAFDADTCRAASSGCEHLAPGSPIVSWLVSDSTDGEVLHGSPLDQPESVREIAQRLYPAYTFDGGRLHLAGCTLDDYVVFWITCRLPPGKAGPDEVWFDLFVGPDGKPLPAEVVARHELDDLVPARAPAHLQRSELKQIASQARRQSEAYRHRPEGEAELVSLVLAWRKYVEGKLRFEIGDAWADLRFADWAIELQPPPFVCPYSGAETYHLALTDDGLIAAADEIEVCSHSGRRVLKRDLRTCGVTGRRALPEFMQVCPVSGELLLRKHLVRCDTCGTRVSPGALQRGRCTTCRTLESVPRSDPRLQEILQAHPGLHDWSQFRLGENAAATVLVASKMVRQLLVVLKKGSLEPTRVARGIRWSTAWEDVDRAQYGELID